MTPVVRKLNPNDLEELIDLEKKFNPLRLTDTRAYTNYFLNLDEPDYIFFGAFEQSIITAAIGVINSPELPIWTLNKFYFFDQKTAQLLYNTVIDIQEQKNLYQYFTCIEKLNLQKYKILDNQRYNTYLEHIVLPEQLTGYENIDHDVLNYVKENTTRLIHLRVLKNEYRAY
jgi:hypothetical protein